ncbi:peptidase activity protein [[Candida] boidinii]|nr:peptidase activity protein [[Candida] boidinii]
MDPYKESNLEKVDFPDRHDLMVDDIPDDLIVSSDSSSFTGSEKEGELIRTKQQQQQQQQDQLNSINDDINTDQKIGSLTPVDSVLDPLPPCYKTLDQNQITWKIRDFAPLKEGRVQGPRIKIGGFEWNLLIIPSKRNGYLSFSMYVEAHPQETKENNDSNNDETDEAAAAADVKGLSNEDKDNNNWHVCTQFAIEISDPKNPKNRKLNKSRYRYSNNVTDWGFINLLSMKIPNENAMIQNNEIDATIYVRVIDDWTGVLWFNFENYNSKKQTGYVGFYNQGATCYLNSLLQSYFFTMAFRKKVLKIPTQDEVAQDIEQIREQLFQRKSVSLALQRIFYKLQTSNEPIDTLELTKSFGWDSSDAFTQHDVQELNRILMDKLETKMKNTEIEGCLNDIFVGKMKSFIRCINVDYESSRIEDFWDIQLNVKSLKNVKESFENYVESEVLSGDNKYDAAGYGLQDAEKGVIFESFPPVLYLQLKRFEYNFEYDQLVKINDRYEFFDSIDLKPYLDKSANNYDEDWEYELHHVLVHQGDVSVGHYYAMIKPTPNGSWYRFDDDKVWKVTNHEVFEENFGVQPLTQEVAKSMTRDQIMDYQLRRATSAYMLVYVRKCKSNDILKEVDINDIPKHIPKQLEIETKEIEKIKKEEEEKHLYINFKLFTDDNLINYQGFDLCPSPEQHRYYAEDLFDENSFPSSFRLLKTDPLSKLYDTIAGIIEYKPENFRVWHVSKRQNGTHRPHSVIPSPTSSTKDKSENDDDDDDSDIIKEKLIGDIFTSSRNNRRSDSTSSHYTLYVEQFNKDLKFIAKHLYEMQQNKEITKKFDIDSNNFIDYFKDIVTKISSYHNAPCEMVSPNSENILIFFKYFDAKNQTLKGITHTIISHSTQISNIVSLLNLLMSFELTTDLNLFEEIGPVSIDKLNIQSTFYKSELCNGDIICFSEPIIDENKIESLEYPTIKDFYNFLESRVHLRVAPLVKADEDEEEYVVVNNKDKDSTIDEKSNSNDLKNPKDETVKNENNSFEFWISSYVNYEKLANKIAKKINTDYNYLRIFAVGNNNTHYALNKNLNFKELFNNTPQSQTVDLRYEILNVTLNELEKMKSCNVIWLGHGVCRPQTHDFMLPENSTVDDIINRLQNKVGFESEKKDDILVWAEDNHRLSKLVNTDTSVLEVSNIICCYYPEAMKLIDSNSARQKDEDDDENDENENDDDVSDFLVPVFQCYSRAENVHGIPFLFVLKKDEELVDTRKRLHKILGISEKEFQRVHIGLYEYPQSLNVAEKDDIILYNLFANGNNRIQLCIEHPGRYQRQASVAEPSIFIRD